MAKRKTWLKKKHSVLLAKLQNDYFNPYIKYSKFEQGYTNCISCGKPLTLNTHDCQAGHYIPISVSSRLRFEEDNVWPQCSRCNKFMEGNSANYRDSLVDILGIDRVEEIESLRHDMKKYTRNELVDMIFDYKEKLEEYK